MHTESYDKEKKKLFGCPPHLPPAGERAGGFLFLFFKPFF